MDIFIFGPHWTVSIGILHPMSHSMPSNVIVRIQFILHVIFLTLVWNYIWRKLLHTICEILKVRSISFFAYPWAVCRQSCLRFLALGRTSQDEPICLLKLCKSGLRPACLQSAVCLLGQFFYNETDCLIKQRISMIRILWWRHINVLP